MKKLLGFVLIVVFAISLYLSINNELVSNKSVLNDAPSYASILPIPPPPPPARRGC